MNQFNVLNNKFMKSALQRKSEKTIKSNVDSEKQSSNSLNWEGDDTCDSPLRYNIRVPELNYPRLINSVRSSNSRLSNNDLN